MHDSPDLIAPEKSVTKPGSTLSFFFYFFFGRHIYFQSSMGALPHRVSCLNVSIGPCISPCSLLGTLRYMLVLPYFCLVSPSPSPSPFLLLLLCTQINFCTTHTMGDIDITMLDTDHTMVDIYFPKFTDAYLRQGGQAALQVGRGTGVHSKAWGCIAC